MDLLTHLRGAGCEFALDVCNKVLHLCLHFFQSLPHIQNDFNAGQIHTQISGQIQNQLEPFNIILSI